VIPGECERRFRRIVSTTPAHREQPKRLMLEPFQTRQTSWFPPKLPEETIIDVVAQYTSFTVQHIDTWRAASESQPITLTSVLKQE
jgi:hypothetical protein